MLRLYAYMYSRLHQHEYIYPDSSVRSIFKSGLTGLNSEFSFS